MEKITIQTNLCNGCLDCEEACAKLHGISMIKMREVDNSYYPIVCQKCEDAPCILSCPTDAISIEGILQDKCIGCGLCMRICPFGAVVMNERKAHKCDQCIDLDSPVCIKACSKRAIAKVDIEKLNLEKQINYVEKLANNGKNRKAGNLIGILTANTRAKKRIT